MENMAPANAPETTPKGTRKKVKADKEAPQEEPAAKSPKLGEHGHHNTYSDKERELVVVASATGGARLRHSVAALLNMPRSTADAVVRRYNQLGECALHDHRHDAHHAAEAAKELAAAKPAAAKPAAAPRHDGDEAHEAHAAGRVKLAGGHGAKKNAQLVRLIQYWTHYDASLTFEAIKELVNLEVFRQLASAQELLTAEDAVPGAPIAETRIVEVLPKVYEDFAKRSVHSTATIKAWTDGIVMSRKYRIDSMEAVNSAELTSQRADFARDMLASLEDNGADVVWLDALPLWLDMSHPPTGLPRKERAAVATEHGLHESVHCYLACSAGEGLMMGEVFAGAAPPTDHTHGVVQQHHGLQFDPVQFSAFLERLCERIANGLDKAGAPARNVFIVCDAPLEFVLKLPQEPPAPVSRPNWQRLQAKLAALGKTVTLIRIPPQSPTLNLAEVAYTFRITNAANEHLHELQLHEEDHAAFLGSVVGSGGGKTLLEKVVKRAIHHIRQEKPRSADLAKLVDLVKSVRDNGGRVDIAKSFSALSVVGGDDNDSMG